MKNINNNIKVKKELKREEYNFIRNSNSSLIHKKIKYNVESTLKV